MEQLTYSEYTQNADVGIINENFRKIEKVIETLEKHTDSRSNPHDVTKTNVGLGNVLNEKQATATEFQELKEQVNSISDVICGMYNNLNYTTTKLDGGQYQKKAFINLGFTPAAVEVYTGWSAQYGHNCGSGSGLHLGGLALKDKPCYCSHTNNLPLIEVTENGFFVYSYTGFEDVTYCALNDIYGERYFTAYKNAAVVSITGTGENNGADNVIGEVTE